MHAYEEVEVDVENGLRWQVEWRLHERVQDQLDDHEYQHERDLDHYWLWGWRRLHGLFEYCLYFIYIELYNNITNYVDQLCQLLQIKGTQ